MRAESRNDKENGINNMSINNSTTHKKQAESNDASESYTDLAPMILRQRLVIEGFPESPITAMQIADYLSKLSDVCDMKTLIEPVTHCSDTYGWAGWIHWESSGAHFYAWDQPVLFFSVDIYTCKAFDPKIATQFTKDYFNASVVTAKEF